VEQNKCLRVILSITCLLLGWGDGSRSAAASPASREADAAFTFRLTTPEPRVALRPDGFHDIEIEGFGTRLRRSGAPDVPVRSYLVAIPPGAEPVLEVRPGPEFLRPGVRPRAVPGRAERARAAGRTDLRGVAGRPDTRIYCGRASYPETIAWLGEPGVLRDQRYVPVFVAPVRYDARRGGLSVHREVEVTVRFEGAATASATAGPADPRFESTYRSAFVNYEQGRTFRLDTGAAAPELAPADLGARSALGTPSGPRLRILVREHGFVVLDHATLDATDFAPLPMSTWRLENRGEDVPFEILDDGDDVLEPGEGIRFWGQALDDEPKTVLNTDIPESAEDIYEAADFSDENVYVLLADGTPPAPLPLRDAAPGFVLTPPGSFTDTAVAEQDTGYRPLGPADPWYWSPALVLASAPLRSEAVPLPGLASATAPLAVRVRMRGSTEDPNTTPDHPTRITLRNATAQTLTAYEDAFDGLVEVTQEVDWTWPGSGPTATNPLTVRLEVLPAGASCPGVGPNCNGVLLDRIEIDYQRAFVAMDDVLVLTWPDGDAELEVSNLSSPSAVVWEIGTAPGLPVVAPVRLTGAAVSGSGPYMARFRVDQDPNVLDGTPRRFVVAGPGAMHVPAPADVEPDTVSDLRDPANQADLIVIAHPDALDDAPGSSLDQYLAHRASPAGGGLSSKVVRIQDVYDEFGDGLSSPNAIRELLRFVLSEAPGEGWADPKPSAVLLLGDGTFDYKGGTAQGNLVPTLVLFSVDAQLGYWASDTVLATVAGDDAMPDLQIGRLPARTVAEAELMLDKIVAYETAPPLGSWRRHSLFITDRDRDGNTPVEGDTFRMANEASFAHIDAPPYTYRHLDYWNDYFDTPDPTPWDSINADIDTEVNGTAGATADGAAVVQFVGHGNFVLWSDDFYWDERVSPPSDTFQDSMDLANGGRTPFLMVHNCLTGGFHFPPNNTVGENWLRHPNGGAVAVLAPSGLSFAFVGNTAGSRIWDAMFGARRERSVGALAFEVQLNFCVTPGEECSSYALLGDPLTRLVLPSVDPASDLAAVDEGGQVDLTWTASATPGVTYDVLRRWGSNSYSVIGSTSGTTWTDPNVVFTITYQYAVVARDAEGFRSPWSNTNTDCTTNGPDCVQVTPLNPNPPAIPTGVALHYPGIGTVLELSWNANSETDLASYTVEYGTDPGNLDATLVTGKFATRVLLQGLTQGQPVYAAVRATNTSNKTSARSPVVSDFPVFGPGLRPPRYVDDLRVSPAGADVLLGWSEVTTDIYGKPAFIARYDVLRGTGANFAPDAWTVIGSCTAPCVSYTDPGAMAAPDSYHYRVVPVDSDELASALGSNPPAGPALEISKDVLDGHAVLAWTPVTTTTDGAETTIAHYVVYESDQPFGRDSLPATPLATVTGTSLDLTASPGARYYSVLAVDVRGNVSPY